jgi:hypothetical protein
VINYVINNQIKLLTYKKPSNILKKKSWFQNIPNDFFLAYYNCKIFIQDECFLQIVILNAHDENSILQIALVGIFFTNIC